MNVNEALDSRKTVRAFGPDPISRETVKAIFDAANRTPSWANTQPWEIYLAAGDVLDGLKQKSLENFRNRTQAASDVPRAEEWPREIAARMKELMTARFAALGIGRDDREARREMGERSARFFDAPAVAFLCLDRTLTSWSMHDLGMMSQSIMLAAREHGVDSAIAYNFVIYPAMIRAALEIPENLNIIIGIALGHEDTENPHNSFRSQRRPLAEVLHLRGI